MAELDSIKCRVTSCPGMSDHIITEEGKIYRIIGSNAIEMTLQVSNGHLTYQGRLVSHLVLEAFVGPKPFPRAQALHFPDSDVSNNKLMNLRWGTKTDSKDDSEILHQAHEKPHEWCSCEKLPDLRCPIHPWVCVNPLGNAPLPPREKEVRPHRRPGRATQHTAALNQELRDDIAKYHLSDAKPTLAETARKFGVSTRTVNRCADAYYARIHAPKV